MSYGNNAGLEYGVALTKAIIQNTASSTGVLDATAGAVTAACSGTLHVTTAVAGATYAVVIEHSDTLGSGYAPLVTFTLDGSAVGAQRITVASALINKYRRVTATKTGAGTNDFGFAVHFRHA
jgi:hypothetical protein